MAKAEASVEELVGMIERGELRLPEMQRRYVWQKTRVRDLLDSLYRGYPSGAILLWETDEDVPLQEMAVAQQANPYKTTRLLLDGQQRLTSLAAVIRGKPVSVRGRKKPIELLFNLDHPEELAVVTEVNENGNGDAEGEDPIDDEADSTEDELQKRFNRMTFVVATKKLEQLPQWVRVADVFKSDDVTEFLEKAGVSDFKDPNFKRYSQRLAKLRGVRNYVYRMDVLERSLSYDEVTEIFVRVNSLGAKLRSSDLALAQITAKWRNSLKTFQEFQAICGKSGFDLDLGVHLKNLVAFTTGQSRFATVGGLGVDKLKAGWEASRNGMEFAMNFVKSNVGIDSPTLLSSPFLLIALGYFGHKRAYELTAEESARLRYWVLVANAKGRYSRGSSETILDQDLATLRKGGGAQEMISSPTGWASRHRTGGVGGAEPTERALQDHVPCVPGRGGEGLALAGRDRAQPLRNSGQAPVPPHLPEGDLESELHGARGGRHLQPVLHRRKDEPPDQRQVPRAVLPRDRGEVGSGGLCGPVHPDGPRAPRHRELQGVPRRAPDPDRQATQRFPRRLTVRSPRGSRLRRAADPPPRSKATSKAADGRAGAALNEATPTPPMMARPGPSNMVLGCVRRRADTAASGACRPGRCGTWRIRKTRSRCRSG